MSKKLLINGVSALLMIFLLAGTAMADRRHFVWTYQYMTMPAGRAELEYYYGYELADRDIREDGKYVHQLEVEAGITDRCDVSLYQMWSQTNGSGFDYDGFKIRARYRLFEAGRYPVDPLLYFEVKRPSEHTSPTAVEGKLILAREYGRFFAAYNMVVERELGSEYETEWKYDVGFGYQVIPAVSFGVESKGNFESGGEGKRGLGPTVSLAKGSVWMTSGILFPLTDQTSDIEFRYILGIYL